MPYRDQNGVPLAGLEPYRVVNGTVCTVPFSQPVQIDRLPSQHFFDDFASYDSLAALAASAYATGDLDANYTVSNASAFAAPLVVTPAANSLASLVLPVYLTP